MRKSPGIIMPLVVTFMALFIMVGLGSLQYGGMQQAQLVKSVGSTQALWAAEAGVERSRQVLKAVTGSTIYPIVISGADANISTADYNVSITLPAYKPWRVVAMGHPIVTPTIVRTIYATLGYGGLLHAISTTGTVSQKGTPTISSLIEHVNAVTFESIFGITLAQAAQRAVTAATYYDFTGLATKNVSIPMFTNKIAYVKMNGDQTLKLSGNGTASNLLIVEGGTLDMSGGGGSNVNFTGIIWIEGGSFSKISGSELVNGSIYINSSPITNTVVNGGSNLTITYDQAVVNTVLNLYGAGTLRPRILCWAEVDQC